MKRLSTPQDAVDARNEFRPAFKCPERKRLRAAQEFPPLQLPALQSALCKRSQAGCIGARSLRPLDHPLVASHLALAAKATLHPYQRRIQRKQNETKFL